MFPLGFFPLEGEEKYVRVSQSLLTNEMKNLRQQPVNIDHVIEMDGSDGRNNLK